MVSSGETWVRIMARIEGLAREPRPAGMKKLEGMKELYRVRVGDYRVVYQIQDGTAGGAGCSG